MRVYKGNIITCNDQQSITRYLVVDKDRICFVGDNLPIEYTALPIEDLGGQALVPAFVDAHIHFASFALFHSGLNLMTARSIDDILATIDHYAQQSRDKILIMFGISAHSVPEKRLLTRLELDQVTYGKPAVCVKYDGHALVANSAMIQQLNDDTRNLRGYDGETGEMNQEAFFHIIDQVTNSVSPLQLVRNMLHAADALAQKGIGMVHTVSGVGFPGDLDVTMETLFAKGCGRGFQTRVLFQTMSIEKVVKRRLPRIGGCFETALDGCFGSKDAALHHPYEGSVEQGILFYDDETVTRFCIEANRENLDIQLHAIGDAAFDQATRALTTALEDHPRDDHRHTIIHACLPTEQGLELCRQQQIILSMQSAFIDWPQEPSSYTQSILGNRAQQLNPIRTIQDQGIRITLGSDGPCTDPHPMMWIHKAVNNSNSQQRISVQDALQMATFNGYFASRDDDLRGTLEAGKIADMVILSHNPYTVDPAMIQDIQVKQLMLSGQPYQPQSKSVLGLLIRSLFSRNRH